MAGKSSGVRGAAAAVDYLVLGLLVRARTDPWLAAPSFLMVCGVAEQQLALVLRRSSPPRQQQHHRHDHQDENLLGLGSRAGHAPLNERLHVGGGGARDQSAGVADKRGNGIAGHGRPAPLSNAHHDLMRQRGQEAWAPGHDLALLSDAATSRGAAGGVEGEGKSGSPRLSAAASESADEEEMRREQEQLMAAVRAVNKCPLHRHASLCSRAAVVLAVLCCACMQLTQSSPCHGNHNTSRSSRR